MYWTDTTPLSPKIEMSWMNGENRTILVSDGLGNPTGITIDFWMNHRIFWCDSKEKKIESMNADGTDRVLVIATQTNHPFSLDVFTNSLYWVSKDTGSVLKQDKFGRGISEVLQTGLLMPHAIKVHSAYKGDLSGK